MFYLVFKKMYLYFQGFGFHICYEGAILIMRFLLFHCALNCSLWCFSIPKDAVFFLAQWLKFNTKQSYAKCLKFVLTGKKLC